MKGNKAKLIYNYNEYKTVTIESEVYQSIVSDFGSPARSGSVHSVVNGVSCVCVSMREDDETFYVYDVPLSSLKIEGFDNTLSYGEAMECIREGYRFSCI